MSAVELNEAFLAKIAGWEAMKRARGFLASGWVLSSNWTPPVLKGVVQEGSVTYRAGLVIKDAIDLENLCSCRDSRQWGTICAHSVAVGLHHLRAEAPTASPSSPVPRANTAVLGRLGQTASSSAGSNARLVKRSLQRAAAGEVGEPLELSVILPPNLGESVARGKIVVCVEAQWRNRRLPLDGLPKGTSFELSARDAALLDGLEKLAGGETPSFLQLRADQLAELLPALAGHPRITLGKVKALAVTTVPWKVALEARLESNGEIVLSAQRGEQKLALLGAADLWVFHDLTVQPLGLPKAYREALQKPLRLPRTQVPQFVGQEWPLLQTTCELTANFRLEDFTLEPQPPRFLLSLAGGLAQLRAQLQCAYGPRIMTIGVTSKEEALWLPDPTCPTRYSTRDLAAEQKAVGRLVRAGFHGPDAQGTYQLLGQNSVLSFFARDYPRLQKEWEVRLEERLERSTAQHLERVEPRFQVVASGEQWFDLSVSFSTSSGEAFSAADIQRLILSGQSHRPLKNGRIALIDTGAVEELQEVLLDCAPEQHSGGYRVSNTQAGFLDAALRQQPGWQVQAPSAWLSRAAQQRGEIPLVAPALGSLENVLRPYQKQGVAWLDFLRQNGFGGILADEMGLGKTLQVLALLQALKDGSRRTTASEGGEGQTTALVVCPTSLVFNWVAEAGKFTPGLRVLALEGAGREALFTQIPEHDLVVTSYALIRRDAEKYQGLEFALVVLDEAQHIKNRQTQNAQAVKSVRARQRLVLTGTPLENSVVDLWSIFDFLMPGYLGSAKDFHERYEVPIARERDANAQARLARRLRPFLLRRLKAEVAPELPAKLEQVAYCDLTADQAGIYRQVLEASRREITEAVDAQGLAKNRLLIFTALLRLRQICCDLRLLKLEQLNPETVSGKLDLFAELLEETIDGGHRVLVFSQFVSMLSLLRKQLTADGVEYCYLDGATQDRAKVVERFQGSAQIPVFLISLKAGGTGLNLTGADTVIHYDPWWNPAVEDQATDRAHRIGQTRVVTSYKLITRGTVEEKILHLQSRKRELFQGVLSSDEQVVGALNWEEIQDLLR
jgi:superfamily II DNA or RNA helicase